MTFYKLTKSLNTSIANLIRRNLTRVKKMCLVLQRTTASIKLNVLTYSL